MTLKELRQECLNCRRCQVGGRTVDGCPVNVFSNMNEKAKLMVVGQNPGYDEVLQGEPFVGASGQFFEQAFKERTGMGRDDIYISNVVRCFTPGNRKPYQSELENCRWFLDKEIELLKPKLIVALGSPALWQLTGLSGISKHRGEPTFSLRYRVVVIGAFHPSPYNMQDDTIRRQFMEDLDVVKQVWGELEREGVSGFVAGLLHEGQ